MLIGTFSPLFITGVLVVLILAAYDPDVALDHLDRIPVIALVVSGALLALNQFLSCVRFHMLLRDFGIQQPFAVSFRTNTFSIVGGLLLFNFFRQSLTRFAFLKNFDRTPAVAFTVTGIERAIALVLLMVMAVIGAFVLFGELLLDFEEGNGLILIIANLAVVLAAVFFLELRRRFRRLLGLNFPGEFLRPALRVGVVTIAMHAAMLAAYTVLAVKLAPSVGLANLLAISAIVMLAAALPISFAGWGIRELSAVYAFGSINIVPEVGLTMAVSIGLLSLAALAANTVIAFKVGRGHGQANSVIRADRGMAAPLTRLLSLAIPIAAASLVVFQLRLPTASDALNVNLADPIVIIGALILGVLAYDDGRWRNLWRVPFLNVFLTLSTLVLGLGFLHGWAVNGVSDWALYNRLIGWLVLLCYMLTGALITATMGRFGFTSMCRVFVIAVAAMFLTELALRLIDQIFGLMLFFWPDASFTGMLGNRNAFAFQLVLALSVAISAPIWLPASGKGITPLAVSGLLLAGLWFAQSRAGFVGAFCVLFIVWHLGHIHLKRIAGSLIVAGVMVSAVYGSVMLADQWIEGGTSAGGFWFLRSMDELGSMQSDRMASLIGGIAMWWNHPVFGAGLGAFIQDQINVTGKALIVHNSALWIAAEMGVVGLLIFALVPAVVVRALYKDGAWRAEWSGIILMACLLVMAVMSMVHDLIYQRAFWLLAGAAIAKPLCLARDRSRADETASPAGIDPRLPD